MMMAYTPTQHSEADRVFVLDTVLASMPRTKFPGPYPSADSGAFHPPGLFKHKEIFSVPVFR